MDWMKRINRWDLLMGMAFLIALLVRLIHLDQSPLSDAEATVALQALELARGGHPSLSPQPLYILLTSALFFIFQATTFLARLLPALAGAGIVFLAGFLREKIGNLPAILLAFLLAMDPGLIAASRSAGSDLLAVGMVSFTAAFWLKKKMAPAGIFAGMAALCGEMAWYGLVVLALSILLSRYLLHQTSEGTLPGVAVDEPNEEHLASQKSTWISAGLTLLSIGTLFLFVPAGLSAFAASVPEYLAGWVKPSGVWPATLLVTLGVYDFLILLFGLWEIWLSWFRKDSTGKIFSIWFGVSLLVAILYPGRQVNHLLWAILPLAVLASRAIARILALPEQKRASSWVYSVFVLIMLVFIYLNVIGLVTPGATPENVQTRMIILISTILVLVVATVLVAAGWSVEPAVYGLVYGLLAALTLGMISTSMGFVTYHDPSRSELWGGQQVLVDEPLVEKTIKELSDWKIGNPIELNVTVVGLDTPSIRWMLRNQANVRYVDFLTGGSTPPLIISPAEFQPQSSTAYRGQDFTWAQETNWGDLSQENWLAWFIWRKAPTQPQPLVLWARMDLFPGGSAVLTTPE